MSSHPGTVSCASMLYEALRIAHVPDRLALNAYKEVLEMAGVNVSTRLDQLEEHTKQAVVTVRWGIGIFVSCLILLSSYIVLLSAFVFQLLERLP